MDAAARDCLLKRISGSCLISNKGWVLREYSTTLFSDNDSSTLLQTKQEKLRKLVSKYGLEEECGHGQSKLLLRGLLWKFFLGVTPDDIDESKYRHLIDSGPSSENGKIQEDSDRTFKGNLNFWSQVKEESIIHVLNAFAKVVSSESIRQDFKAASIQSNCYLSPASSPRSTTTIPSSFTTSSKSPSKTVFSSTPCEVAPSTPVCDSESLQMLSSDTQSAFTFSSSGARDCKINCNSSSTTTTTNNNNNNYNDHRRFILSSTSSTSPRSTSQPPQQFQGSCYVQGMNVLLAPFLYVMSELDAFASFTVLLTRMCPRYVTKNLDGVHHGCALFEKILEILDPDLFLHLQSNIPIAEVYSFKSIMTLMACMQPLDEVLKLWDILFAHGVHLGVLCLVVHVMSIRKSLLSEPGSYKLLKLINEQPLNAMLLGRGAIAVMPLIPESLQRELETHVF